MRLAVYSFHDVEKKYLLAANREGYELKPLNLYLKIDTADQSISFFASNDTSAPILEKLHQRGIKFLLIRTSRFFNRHSLGEHCKNNHS